MPYLPSASKKIRYRKFSAFSLRKVLKILQLVFSQLPNCLFVVLSCVEFVDVLFMLTRTFVKLYKFDSLHKSRSVSSCNGLIICTILFLPSQVVGGWVLIVFEVSCLNFLCPPFSRSVLSVRPALFLLSNCLRGKHDLSAIWSVGLVNLCVCPVFFNNSMICQWDGKIILRRKFTLMTFGPPLWRRKRWTWFLGLSRPRRRPPAANARFLNSVRGRWRQLTKGTRSALSMMVSPWLGKRLALAWRKIT